LEQDEKLNKLTKKTDSEGGLTVDTSLDANLQVDRDRITASGSYIVSSVLDSPFDSVPASPIESRSIYERSLLFGELAAITYHESVDNAEIARVAKNWGFTRIEPYDNGNAEAWRFESAYDVVISCRGTEVGLEAEKLQDVIADLKFRQTAFDEHNTDAGNKGHVHRGFRGEVDDLWLPFVRKDILNTEDMAGKKLWFTGHSLGAGMATIMAGICKDDPETMPVAGLYTFGSPRVGDQEFVDQLDHPAKLTHYRWVNNNDIITTIPPNCCGKWYRHHGKECYIDARGHHKNLNGCMAGCLDGIKGRLLGCGSCILCDGAHDHSMVNYNRHLKKMVEAEKKWHQYANFLDAPQNADRNIIATLLFGRKRRRAIAERTSKGLGAMDVNRISTEVSPANTAATDAVVEAAKAFLGGESESVTNVAAALAQQDSGKAGVVSAEEITLEDESAAPAEGSLGEKVIEQM